MGSALVLVAVFARLVAMLFDFAENSLLYVVIVVVSIPLYWREMRWSGRHTLDS